MSAPRREALPSARPRGAALLVFVELLAAVLLAAPPAAAQDVRYRAPFYGSRRVSAYFDHGGACTDWACGGNCYTGHTGSDFAFAVGTTVLAAAEGTVVEAFKGCDDYGYLGNPCGGYCGNHIMIDHFDGSRTTYCHMRFDSIHLGRGDHVACGAQIGESASSGSSTGPHLHFGHRSPGARSASDPFEGPCGRSNSLWMSQGPYGGSPGGSCQDRCTPSPELCNDVDDDCDGAVDEDLRQGCGTDVGECVAGVTTCGGGAWGACVGEVGPADEVCNGLDDDCEGVVDDEQVCERDEVLYAGSLVGGSADTDVSGDGRADACAFTAGGFACVVAGAEAFAGALTGTDLEGTDLESVSTLRTGDLDGDGRADVCGRLGDRLVCWRSTGDAFGERILGPSLRGMTLLALVDVDGDARLEACVRDAAGLTCYRGGAHGFGAGTTLTALGDAAGFSDITHYGSVRFADLDGDGRTDVCARDADGLDCWRSVGDHFGERVRGPRWSDARGFGALSRWGTLRLGDVTGDGRADACIRTDDAFACAPFEGHGFGDLLLGPRAGAAHDRLDVSSTLRLGDVDGDGRDDLCLREPSGVACWLADAHGFSRRVPGPALSDAAGWSAAARYRSLRLADVSGDGRADLCALDVDGLKCWLSTGQGFGRLWLAPNLGRAPVPAEVASASLRVAGGGALRRDLELVGRVGCSATSVGPGALQTSTSVGPGAPQTSTLVGPGAPQASTLVGPGALSAGLLALLLLVARRRSGSR